MLVPEAPSEKRRRRTGRAIAPSPSLRLDEDFAIGEKVDTGLRAGLVIASSLAATSLVSPPSTSLRRESLAGE